MIELSTNPLNKINHSALSQSPPPVVTKKKPTKSTHVPTACINCKKAHLACDLSRPCKRCTTLGKCDTCIDIKHKKRGRPKLTSSKKWQSTSSVTATIPLHNSNTTATSSPSSNFISLLPMAAPGLASCSFNTTLQNNQQQAKVTSKLASREVQLSKREMMTIFLSMDLCCARVSDESIEFLNIHPGDINQRSFYDLIHSDSSETLSRIHRLLLDNSHSHRVSQDAQQQQPISFTTTASSDLFLTSSPAQLFQIANGSQTLRETLKFKNSGKSMSCRFYLGGGFGADLFVPSTLDHLYMVCIVSDLNSITSASNIARRPTTTTPALQLQHPQLQHSQLQQNNRRSLVDSLLNEPFDSILNNADLLRMYNTTAATDASSTTPSSSHSTSSSASSSSENQTMHLVNHFEAMLAPPPTTPPIIQEHTCSFKETQYRQGNSSSVGGRFSSLNHGFAAAPSVTEIDMKSDIHALLNDDSLFMMNNFNTSSKTTTATPNDSSWGYNIYA